MGSTRRNRYIRWRNGIAHYYRRTPEGVRAFDSRPVVGVSLETSDPLLAEIRRDAVNTATEKLWQHWRTMGESDSALERHRSAIEAAQLLGFTYHPMEELLQASDQELLKRINGIQAASAEESTAQALLGTIDKPEFTLSQALEAFWTLAADRLVKKSDDQKRIWRNSRKRCVANFINVVEDKTLAGISRQDVLNFREWWVGRVKEGNARPNTANNDFTFLADIFQTVVDAHQLDLINPFRGLRLKEKGTHTRRSLLSDEIEKRLLKDGCLSGLNEEARAIVHICAETGARPIEIINRTSEDIILDADIPHVKIRPNIHGELKTPTSQRDIPLLGVALEAFKAYPDGFNRYAGKSSAAVNAINKYFRENGTLPEGASLYSLRHGFQDRLIAVRAPERVQADLMGHRLERPRYGTGPTLEEKKHWLQKTALAPL